MPNSRKWFHVGLEKFCFITDRSAAKICPTIAYRWLCPDSQVSIKTWCSAVVNSPKFCCSKYGFTCATLAWCPRSSGPLALRNFGLSGSECEFFSCYTFPHGNSGGNGSPRACSSSCDSVCNRSPCACSLILSLRIVAGHKIKISQSRDNDVGDVGEVEQEERVDKTLGNEEHEVLRIVLNFLPLFMRCRDRPQVFNPWASQRFK